MSGIGEFAYTVLLGWMRGLFDWFWSLASGTGNTNLWQWVLENWKVWVVILLLGGLVVDWLMWVVRWRPYRLIFGKLRKVPANAAGETWDNGVGFYELETPADTEATNWEENTFATLSEIDPNWAGNIQMASGADDTYDPDYDPGHTGYYTDQYEEPADSGIYQEAESGYWEETPDEMNDSAYYDDNSAAPQHIDYVQDYFGPEADPAQYAFKPLGHKRNHHGYEVPLESVSAPQPQNHTNDEPAATSDAGTPDALPEGFDPFAPYDAYDDDGYSQDAYHEDSPPPASGPDYAEENPAPAAQPPPEDTGPLMFGRPGLWPGQIFPSKTRKQQDTQPIQAGESSMDTEPEELESMRTPHDNDIQQPTNDTYDPLFSPDAPAAPRRRRRRLREATGWQPEDPVTTAPDYASVLPYEDTAGQAPVDDAEAEIPDYLMAPEPQARRPRRTTTIAAMNNARDPFADTRPSRVVKPRGLWGAPVEEDAPKDKKKKGKKDKVLRTVTGKPAKKRGFLRLGVTEDEPISGLPPLDLTNPFMPVVKPDNVDFSEDDSEYYDF